jgi:glucoamylase
VSTLCGRRVIVARSSRSPISVRNRRFSTTPDKLNRQTREFKRLVTRSKQIIALSSNRQKIQFCKTINFAATEASTASLRPFLTGSAPQTEFDVTHSKQTPEKFLTGSRTAIKVFKFRGRQTKNLAPANLPARRGAGEMVESRAMNSKRYWCAGLLVPLLSLAVAATARGQSATKAFGQFAPRGPGAIPTWAAGNKEAVGTSASTESHVWFTLQGGILSEVYYPRLDMADVRSLEFAVSDGKTVWLESKDMEHSIERISDDALLYRQTSREAGGRFTISKTYATDPQRDTLLIDVTFSGGDGLTLYVLYKPALENSGVGDTGYTRDGVLIAEKPGMASALLCSALPQTRSCLAQTSSGFEGASDGYTDLLLHRKLDWSYGRAENGNVMQSAKLAADHFTLALGFGATASAAVESAKSSLQRGFSSASAEYTAGWSDYSHTLRRVNGPYAREFRLAAMVLKAHEDKTFRGAMIASMSVPWGFAVKADTPNVGGYHLVWARDLYEIATGLLAAGDRAAAERALNYLFTVQQKADGSFPQNSWLDGKPYGTALQMDEASYPMILAWQLGKTDGETWRKRVRPEAEFVSAHGPITEQERWEEVPGYSASTMAAEIAGLVCAADIARANGATEDAARYLKTADEWAASIEKILVTTTGQLGGDLASQGYYMRVDDNTDPNDGHRVGVGDGSGTWDERDVVDAGFLELVRLGVRRADDPLIERSLQVVDATLRVETPNGPGFHRYNHDGYGETFFGGPWRGEGIGRVWPVFSGERGEYEIARGRDASVYLDAMLHFANAGGMIPEQVWDRAEPTASHFVFGQGTGSATPLAWSMAQFIRLVVCAEEKRIIERPAIVADHFLKEHQ